jgi:hypothetical protein
MIAVIEPVKHGGHPNGSITAIRGRLVCPIDGRSHVRFTQISPVDALALIARHTFRHPPEISKRRNPARNPTNP